MVNESTIELLFNFMNKVRPEYMGMSLRYEYDTTYPTVRVTLIADGKFPFPIMTFEMFQNLFFSFLYEDMKYFGLKHSDFQPFFRHVIFNGKEIPTKGVIVDDELSNRISDFYNEANKSTTLTVGLNDGTKVELLNNKITTYEEDEGDILYFTYTYTPGLIKMNGIPMTEKSIQYAIDKLNIDNVEVGEVIHIISNLIYEESSDRRYAYADETYEKFYNMIIDSGYSYSSRLTKDIGVFFTIYLRSYQGITLYGSSDYTENDEIELMDYILGFLEGQKGDFPY